MKNRLFTREHRTALKNVLGRLPDEKIDEFITELEDAVIGYAIDIKHRTEKKDRADKLIDLNKHATRLQKGLSRLGQRSRKRQNLRMYSVFKNDFEGHHDNSSLLKIKSIEDRLLPTLRYLLSILSQANQEELSGKSSKSGREITAAKSFVTNAAVLFWSILGKEPSFATNATFRKFIYKIKVIFGFEIGDKAIKDGISDFKKNRK